MTGGEMVVVVGAGFGGLAAALRCLAKGYRVTLVDQLPQTGGRARVFHSEGHTFDAGPTVLTAPFLFDELFALFGESRADAVGFVPLEPWYRYVFPDGRTFDYGGSPEDTCREIERFHAPDADGYRRLVAFSKRIFDKGFTELSCQPFHRPGMMLRQIPALLRLRSYRSVYGLVRGFLRDPYMRRAFSLHPLLVGGNPFTTTSIYALIHYLEREWGVWFACGGTGRLVAALTDLFVRHGGELRLGAKVDTVRCENRRVSGVTLDGGECLPAERVVLNADPATAYARFFPGQTRKRWTDRRLRRLRYSMGLYVLYFGTDRTYPSVAHHTIVFGKTYRETLRRIYRGRQLPEDLSIYLHRPTATDPSLAPPGGDTFYALVPVPNLRSREVDWAEAEPELRRRTLAELEQRLLPDLRRHLTTVFAIDPRHFESDYGSRHGTGFSIAPHLTQSAWFRFHNRSEEFDNLYFVGAGTHPGAGMPGVLCSAKVVDGLIPPFSDGVPDPAAHP